MKRMKEIRINKEEFARISEIILHHLYAQKGDKELKKNLSWYENEIADILNISKDSIYYEYIIEAMYEEVPYKYLTNKLNILVEGIYD